MEGNFIERFKNKVEERLAGVFNHVQNFFLDSSLGIKFHMEKLPTIELEQKLEMAGGKTME